jgi:tetratricopeptide (TPR) repeat protein
VYARSGELDRADEHHKKALLIDKEIGNRLGQADGLGNLGLVSKRRGETDEARKLLHEAADLYEAIGAGGEGPEIVAGALRELEADKEDTDDD